MRHIIPIYILAAAITLSSCASTREGQANPQAVVAGAAIGNNLGSAIGTIAGDSRHGWRGSYRGSAIGSIIGTMAGAAIGYIATKPRTKADSEQYAPQPDGARSIEVTPPDPSLGGLTIRRIRFIDDNHDRTLQAGESGKIIFDIMNEGRETAYNILPFVAETSDNRHITISPSVMVECIEPGCGVKYTATISAGKRLKDGEIEIHVGVSDENGNEGDWQEFALPTSRK